MVHLWGRCLHYCHYICDVIIALKAIVLWMCGGDDHPMWSLMPSLWPRLYNQYYEYVGVYVRYGLYASNDEVKNYEWPLIYLPLHECVIRSLECKYWCRIVSYASMCCVVYTWRCIVVQRWCLPQFLVYIH